MLVCFDVDAEGVDCFSGEPCGVTARTVDGDRPRGDSGLRKGDARCEPKEKGCLAGLHGSDWMFVVSLLVLRRRTLVVLIHRTHHVVLGDCCSGGSMLCDGYCGYEMRDDFMMCST